MDRRRDRGQALLLIALAFVGLVAFIGLAVDAGILFSNIGFLRRAVDSAGLAAANQFREGKLLADMEAAARELVTLNMSSADVQVAVDICATDGSIPGCSVVGNRPPRKLVRVRANTPVNLAFLPVIGIHQVVIKAEAVSEAASLDLMLVIDASPSMAYDLCKDKRDNDGDGETDECETFGTGKGPDGKSENDVTVCSTATDPRDQCQPFEYVRDAAISLVGKLKVPYDRIGLVTFGREAGIPTGPGTPNKPNLPLNGCQAAADIKDCIRSQIAAMQVEPEIEVCPGWGGPGDDPSGCTQTNTAGGLALAGAELAKGEENGGGRTEAVWIIILLSDGIANAAQTAGGDWLCPKSTWNAAPYCQDGDPGTRRPSTDPDYDPDDLARDVADYVGCRSAADNWEETDCTSPGNGVVIFTIGLGDLVIDYNRGGNPTSGEQLLRYIANVGWDGNPSPASDPCAEHAIPLVSAGLNKCGNYYYSKSGADVAGIFDAIASRIFTRITQ